MIRRRGFLTTAAVGTGALATGCGGLGAMHGLGGAEARELCDRLARGMQMLADEPFGSMIPPGRFPRPDLTEHVLRLSIESLLVLDVIRSLPEGAPLPSNVREALAPRLPSLDRGVHTHRALLARMPAPRRRNLDARLRAQPELPMDVAEWVDGHAARIGVPSDNRLRLRHSAVSVGTRMRRQSTNAVLADCTEKLDEVLARSNSALPDELTTHTHDIVDAMWRQTEPGTSLSVPSSRAASPPETRSALSAGGSDAFTSPVLVPDRFGADREMPDPTEPVQWNASWARPGDEEIRLGGIMMPLGLVTCGVLLIAGLITLISGEVQNGEWDGRSHAHDWRTGDQITGPRVTGAPAR